MLRKPYLSQLIPFGFAATLVSCAPVDPDPVDLDELPPLANIDEIVSGAPKADEIPRVALKADEVLPKRNVDLLATQSPVKSQGSRGVCSIFSTVALMEHLYITEGTLENPDFSEQYLQWSAKFQVGSFPRSSGSNAGYNLQAITRFGIVDEATYPYETRQWDTSDHPDCDGTDEQPTECYTNGHPSDEVREATKYRLPNSKWLHPYDVKNHIQRTKTGAIVGLSFFYQAWNHRGSDLPTNRESWAQGYVTYPSAADKEASMAKRAGHSILLVGWEDDQELPLLDEEGNYMLDENGEPLVEKGCYVFKNSWGTTSFGAASAWGPGYGCISYQYVQEYGTVRTAGIPELPKTEICDDGFDNDGNTFTDCDDPACTSDPFCEEPTGTTYTFESTESLEIPDNDPIGVGSTITVTESGTITRLRIQAEIRHSYRGDLTVSLHRGSEAVVLHNKAGGGADDLHLDLFVEDFQQTDLAGDYRLVVVDSSAQDVGSLDSWTITATVE